jgi:PAS domain S-box-containing protein
MIGYTSDELIGRNSLEGLHPDDRPRTAEMFARAVATVGSTLRVDYRYRHKNGSWVQIEAVGTNWLNDPTIAGFVLNCRDNTARKRPLPDRPLWRGAAAYTGSIR